MPDILIALKNGIKDCARDQPKSKNPDHFDPSLQPDSDASVRITFKDILGCMEIK